MDAPPPAALLLALAALVVALARPERTVATERREGTVVMVTDTSGSMLASDVRPNRLTAAREAAIRSPCSCRGSSASAS